MANQDYHKDHGRGKFELEKHQKIIKEKKKERKNGT